MKVKKIVVSLAASAGIITSLVACNDNSADNATKYNVVFKNGDTVISSEQVVEGSYFAVPGAPAAAEGYYFAGWDANGDNVADVISEATADVTYTALFNALPEGAKTVTFMNGDSVVGVVLYNSGDESIVEPQVPAKVGYTGSWEAYELNGDNIVVNASYVATQYYVSFVADGKTISRLPFTVESHEIQNPQVPAKEGYTGSWESYSLDGVTGDIVVNAVYTANPVTINDFLGVYTMGEESITVTPTAVEAHIYDSDFDRYVDRTFEADVEADYYFKVEGSNLNLYDYMDTIQKSYQLVDGQLVTNAVKTEVSAWGTYEYKVDGVLKGTLKIDDSGVSYVVGDTVYDAAYAISSSSIVIVAGEDNLTFALNSNNNYELTVDGVAEEFVKVVPTEWYGTYYYAQNYPSQIVISDDTINDIKIVKDGFEYQGVTFIPTENGGLNYIDYSGSLARHIEYIDGEQVDLGLAVYAKMETVAIPDTIYGTYRGSYTAITISADGITLYGQLVPMADVIYSVGDNGSGSQIALITAGTYSLSMTDGVIEMYGSNYYLSNVEDTTSLNTTIPADYDSYKDKLYTGSGLLFEITGNSISYNASGYENLKFFVDEDNKIHMFKNNTYAAADEVVVEIVDGKLVIDGVELVEFNVSLADIAGTYLNGDEQIVISADGVEYAGESYAVADIEISVYDIKLSADVTLVYNPDSSSIVVGDKTYNYSSTLSLGIPESMYGTYYDPNMGKIVIDKTGFTYFDNWGSPYACTVSVSDNVYSLDYVQYGSELNITVSYDADNSQFTGDYDFVKLPAQTIPSAWVAGTYSGEIQTSWGANSYSVEISSNSIAFTDAWGSVATDFIIISDTEFYVGSNSFVYNVADQTITVNIPGEGSCVLAIGGADSGSGDDDQTSDVSVNSAMIGTWSGTDSYGSTWLVEITDTDGVISLAWVSGSIEQGTNPTDFSVIDENTIIDGMGYQFHYDETKNVIVVTDTLFGDPSFELTLGGR